MKRRLISVLLTAAMAVSCLSACGGAQSGEDAGSSGGEAQSENVSTDTGLTSGSEDAETVLKWAVWDAKIVKSWKAIADAYTEQHPDVRIEMVDLGSSDYQTVLSTELSGSGSDFDVVTIKDMPGYATLVSKGVLEPLSDRIEQDGVDLSVYNGAAEQFSVDGTLYQLPYRNDFWVLFYNKDVFDAAGVEYPTNDMTIEEYDALARSVAKEGFGDEQVFGSHYHTWKSTVQLFGTLDGKNSILSGNYDFMKPYYEMVMKQEDDGICRSYIDINASQLNYGSAFAEGNTATMNIGSWFVTTLMSNLESGEYDKDLCGNWGIVKYPHPEGVEAGTTIGTITGLAVTETSEHKDAAWDFLKFATGEEGAEIVAETGLFPAVMSDSVIDIISGLDGFPQDEASKEALHTTKVYLEAPYDKNIAEINTILDTYHKDIMNRDISVDEGIQKMSEEVSALK